MNNLDAAKESGAILSCLARHRLAGSEKHFSQFRHHSFDVHQLEHVLREDGDEKAIQRRFPRLTPLESPPRVSRGIRQLISEGVGIVLVDTKLHKKPEQGAKTILPPFTPGSAAPPSKSSAAEDIVKMAETSGCNKLRHPACGSLSQ